MSQKSPSQILPLLEVGSHIRIATFEDTPDVVATVTDVFQDGFGAMTDDNYIEIYEENIDQLVDILR
jgi:hypothetical protein